MIDNFSPYSDQKFNIVKSVDRSINRSFDELEIEYHIYLYNYHRTKPIHDNKKFSNLYFRDVHTTFIATVDLEVNIISFMLHGC